MFEDVIFQITRSITSSISSWYKAMKAMSACAWQWTLDVDVWLWTSEWRCFRYSGDAFHPPSIFGVGRLTLDVGRLAWALDVLALALDVFILALCMDGNGVGVGDGRLALALDVWILLCF